MEQEHSKLRTQAQREAVLFRRLEKKRAHDPTHSRISRLAGIARNVTVPFVIGYFVFFVDFGEKEHVFSAPRRWLERQKAAFWSLSPSEQQTAEDLKRQ
ncbi:hypothetical protein FRC03_000079 [Tulasnella sp. 419]|nr:hypothetical protein FRC03_000079 [Tulasnella sp. 419]